MGMSLLAQRRLLALCLISVLILASARRKSAWRGRRGAGLHELQHQDILEVAGLNNRTTLVQDITNIGIERVSDTPGNRLVREYIIATLEELGWTVETDASTQATPLGQKTFVNIMATKYPLDYDADKRVIISAHYDSKFYSNFEFIGATDSVAPCAILLDLARTLNSYLSPSDSTALQLVFFDGEEAFVSWTGNDNTYGSRNLASVWDNQNRLSNIDLFILLDLIGESRPSLWSFWDETLTHYRRMQEIERVLSDEGIMGPTHTRNYFRGKNGGSISDDHKPFLQRGVPVVHLISHPFPSVWHKASDTVGNLDIDSVLDVAAITRVFAVELTRSSNIARSGARRLRFDL